jgi:hypothetical protein
MKRHLDPQVFRPSILNGKYQLNAPLVRSEGRILSCAAPVAHNWSQYERPAYERLPSRAECASMFGQLFERLLAESA